MKFEVRKYYSTFMTVEVEANNEEEAYNITKGITPSHSETYTNLEEWEEANEVFRIEENRRKK
jgi:hypothetical protein